MLIAPKTKYRSVGKRFFFCFRCFVHLIHLVRRFIRIRYDMWCGLIIFFFHVCCSFLPISNEKIDFFPSFILLHVIFRFLGSFFPQFVLFSQWNDDRVFLVWNNWLEIRKLYGCFGRFLVYFGFFCLLPLRPVTTITCEPCVCWMHLRSPNCYTYM